MIFFHFYLTYFKRNFCKQSVENQTPLFLIWFCTLCRCPTVADPGPLMLGVLDRWTPTVNILLTLIAQISFHIELCPIEARYSISLYTTHLSIWLSGFRDFFFDLFCLKSKCPRRVINLNPRCVVGLTYRKH